MKNRMFFLRLVALANAALVVHGASRVVAQESLVPAPSTAPAPPEPVVRLPGGAEEVLKLSRAKVGDDVIVAFVQNPGRRYNLTADQLLYLRKAGVSDRVLTAMLTQSSHPALPAPQPAAPAPSSIIPPTPPGNATQNALTAPPPVYQAAPEYAPAEATYVAPEPAAYYYYNSYPSYGYSYSYPAFSLGFGFGAGCSYPYYGGYYGRYPYYGYGSYNCRYPYYGYGGYNCGNGYGYRNGYFYANGCYNNGYYYANGNNGTYYRGGQPVNGGNNGNRVMRPGGAGSAPNVRSPVRAGAGTTLASVSRPAPRSGSVRVTQSPADPGMRNPAGNFRSPVASFRGGSGSPGATSASFSRPAPRSGGGSFAGVSRPAPQGGGRSVASFSGSRGGGGGFARGGGGGGRR